MAEVKVDTGKAQENVNNLQKEMRKLLVELRNLESGSDEFVKLSEKVGELQDKINDAGEAARANAGPAFERLGNNFGLVTQKLASLDFAGAAESMKALGSSIGSISFKELTDGLKNFGSTMVSVGKALFTNPIFLVAAALTAAYLAFDAYREAQEAKVNAFIDRVDARIEGYKRMQQVELAEAQGNAEKIYQINEKYRQKEIDGIKSQMDKLKSFNLGRNGMTDEQKAKLEELNKRYLDLLNEQEVAEINHTNTIAAERSKQLENYNTFIKGVDDRYQKSTLSARQYELEQAENQYREDVKRLNDARGSNENYHQDLLKIATIYRETQKQINNKFDQEAAQKRKQREAIDKQEAQEKEEKDKKAAEEKLKREKELQDQLIAALNDRANEEERIAEEIFQADMTAQEREIQAVRDAYFEKIELAKQYGLESNILINEQNKAEEDINKKYRDAEDAAIKASNEKKKQQEQQLLQSKFQMASDAMGALSSLNDALAGDSEKSAKRAFKINKALSLAQAIMSTYQAVNAQLAVPQNALTGTAFIKAGIALAAGIANVIKIQKTKFEGGGGSPSPSGGGGGGLVANAGDNQSTATPAFNVLDTGFLSDRPAQGAPVQAYVLSSDVSSSLEASQKVQSLSVL